MYTHGKIANSLRTPIKITKNGAIAKTNDTKVFKNIQKLPRYFQFYLLSYVDDALVVC